MGHCVIGVDIGGTKIAAGRTVSYGEMRGEVDGAITVPTRAADGFETSIAQVWTAIERVLTPGVSAIGICAPGPLDPNTGVILNPPNLPGWIDIPLVKLTEQKFGLPVHLENDCDAAAVGEAAFGAGRGHPVVFYSAIGTGIGAGIVIDGKLFRGAHNAAGEAGHVTVDYRSPIVCTCGARGCIEALASGSAIERDHGAAADHLDAYAAWLASIVSLLDPSIIILGGGVLSGHTRAPLLARLREQVPKLTVNPFAARIPIVEPKLGALSGVIGAAEFARAEPPV